MLYGAIVGAIAGSLVWLVFYIAASASKAAGRAFPANTMTCLTMLPPAETLQAVRQGLQAPYAVDETGTAPDAIGETFNILDDDLPSVSELLSAYRRAGKPLRCVSLPQAAIGPLSSLYEWYHHYSKGQLPGVIKSSW